jgi:hypothetical protein
LLTLKEGRRFGNGLFNGFNGWIYDPPFLVSGSASSNGEAEPPGQAFPGSSGKPESENYQPRAE